MTKTDQSDPITKPDAGSSVFEKLGYREIESAKFYQFVKPIGASQHVKLDLLAGPLGEYEDRVKDDPRRVRPRPSVSLHARRVDEVLGIEESCMEIKLAGHQFFRREIDIHAFMRDLHSVLEE